MTVLIKKCLLSSPHTVTLREQKVQLSMMLGDERKEKSITASSPGSVVLPDASLSNICIPEEKH
jgi:hypothetical protein